MSENRMEVKAAGVVIGTASGWDYDYVLQFYDFKSNMDAIPDTGCLTVDPWEGFVEAYIYGPEDANGNADVTDTIKVEFKDIFK